MGDYNWKEHKCKFDELFFKDSDYIRYRSDHYRDFWKFFWRYQNFKKKSDNLSNPEKAEQKEKIQNEMNNFKIGDVRDFVSHGKRMGVPKQYVLEFHSVVLKYIDFCQKHSFRKLSKLRTQQRNLPIAKYRDEIVKAVENHQVVIVAGDTGCGKSTQVPQYLLASGFTNIACTQPRRIAAISLSKRVGYETLNQFGSLVAYQIRFDKTKTSRTKILFLTEGLLLRQMQTDTNLEQYSVIILDEVHERHLQSDFLLGMFKNVLEKRENLKIILMSATINLKLFQDYFKDAPVIQVPGRLYPIKVEYFPITLEDRVTSSGNINPLPYVRIMQLIDKRYPSSEHGDLLIFLSGMAEISTVAEAARKYADETRKWIILCLHSTLSVDDQDKAFDIAPEGTRKCILSTNIAETSVTIDGIRFVADSGKVKEMNYDDHNKMQILKECWVSRASAEQRKGRAGRTGPGVCFRLFSEEDYEALIPYTVPDILRLPLENLILQMKSMKVVSVQDFQFIEPPSKHAMENYIDILKTQGALNHKEELTPIGNILSQLPLNVVMGKVLVMGTLFDMKNVIISIASLLSIQSPFTFNAYRNLEATEMRKSLESDHGDAFTLLTIFNEWIKLKGEKRVVSRKWCKRRCVEEQRLYEAVKLQAQFKDLLQNSSLLAKEPDLSSMSSYERKQRHSNRKNLRKIQAKHIVETRKRKRLKLGGVLDEESSDEEKPDIHDLKFNLQNDAEKLASETVDLKNYLRKDMNILKMILCSSLYPQFAIADEFNSYQSSSDLIFHTRSKPFVTLHPTGYFANHTDILDPFGSFLNPKGKVVKTEKGVLSSRHQLLVYESLLETKKPYIVNAVRVPALQSLLLFSRFLDTNEDCSRIVCDEWIELIVSHQKKAEEALLTSVKLRHMWDDLLRLKLKPSSSNETSTKYLENLQSSLTDKLGIFLENEIVYQMRRIGSTEKKNLYIGCEADDLDSREGGSSLISHPQKGGLEISCFLVYNCLSQIDSKAPTVSKPEEWTCEECGCMLYLVAEKLHHQTTCNKIGEVEAETIDVPSTSGRNVDKRMAKKYHCDICDTVLELSAVEILKHKRSHR